jgi:hypothetical protein
MAAINDLCDINFKFQKVTQGGNIFTGNGKICLLKPINREYSGTIKKPIYYLNWHSKYLTGLFATNNATEYSDNYKNALSIKPIVRVAFTDTDKTMMVKAASS